MDLDAINDGRIVRDGKRFFGGIVGAVVVIGLLAFVWLRPHHAGGVRIVLSGFAVVGLVYLAYLVLWPGSGHCPECGCRLTGLALQRNAARACPGCKTYLESSEGRLEPSSADSVAPYPAFMVPCPEGEIRWPDGCCVCGAPATRAIELELEHRQDASLGKSLAVSVASAGFLKLVQERKIRLEVPHCVEHDDGVALGFSEQNQLPYFEFRSKRYADAFRQLNPEPMAWVDPD